MVKVMRFLAPAAAIALAAMIPRSAVAITGYAGIGFAKDVEAGSPDGGAALVGGIVYKMPGTPLSLGVGLEAGYNMLGSREIHSTEYEGRRWFAIDGTRIERCIPVTAQLYYLPRLSASLRAYLDAGIGYYISSSRAEIRRTELDSNGSHPVSTTRLKETTDDRDPGVNFGIGAIFGSASSRLAVGPDVKFHQILTNFGNEESLTARIHAYLE